MEDYKEKYEQALSQAEKELKCCGSLDCDAARQIFRLFPELKESEEGKIKKDIIAYMRYERKSTEEEIENRFIPWLEKQGEQKLSWSEEDKNTVKVLINIIKKSEMIDPLIYTDLLKEKLFDWLKSLKERMKGE